MLADTHRYHRQIVFSAALVATSLQLAAQLIEVVAGHHQLSQLVIRNVTRNTVSAEQKLRTVFNLHRFHVDFDALLSAERTTDHVLARMIRRLFRRHASGAHFLFDARVVFSFAMELSIRCETVESGITDMTE